MSRNRTILFCPPASASPFIDELRKSIKKGERVVIIAPTAYAARELELNLLGFSDVSAVWDRIVFTFASFAEKILGDLRRKPLTHAAQMFILEQAASRMSFDYYRDVCQMIGFLGLVRDLIQELKGALVFPDSFYDKVIKPLSDAEGREVMPDISHLVEVYELMRGYQNLAQELGGDEEDLIFSAANLLAKERQKDSLDKFILFGFSDLSALQWLIFESAIRAFDPGEIIFLMPFMKDVVTNQNVVGFGAARWTIDRLKSQGFSEVDFKGTHRGFNLLARSVLTGGIFDEADADVEMIEFFDEQEEVEGVLKKWQLEVDRFGLEQTLVLSRQSQKFGDSFWSLLWHSHKHLADHFIPQFSHNTALGILLELMNAVDKQDKGALFAAIKHLETPDKFRSIWRKESDLLWQGGAFDISELLSELAISSDLRNFILSSTERKKPDDWLNITRSFAYRLLAPRLLASSPSQLGVLSDFISELNNLNELRLFGDEELSFGEWSKNCSKTFELMQTSFSGMFFNPVRSPFEIRGGSADCIIICGLNLKEFPNQPQENALLNDKARNYLFSKSRLRLRTTKEIYEEEWPLFYQSVSAARKKLILTRYRYVKRDAKIIPSPFWNSVENLLKKEAFYGRSVIDVRKASAKRLFGKEKIVQIKDEKVKELITFWLTGREDIQRMRANGALVTRRSASVSCMDDLVKCPYMLFAQSVLELSSREDKTSESIWQRKRGIIVHKAFEYMLQNAVKLELEEIKQLLRSFAKKELEQELFMSLTAEQVAEFDIWAKKLKIAYERFQEFRDFVLSPVSQPLIEHKNVIVFNVDENIQLKLMGKLDFVEQLGDEFLVIDFKTSAGSTARYSLTGIDKNGKPSYQVSVQLPLYAQAEEFGDKKLLAIAIFALRVPAIYFFAEKDFWDRLNNKLGANETLKNFVIPLKSEENLKEFLREFLEGSLKAKLMDLIQGKIERKPINNRVCQNCDVRDFCRNLLH